MRLLWGLLSWLLWVLLRITIRSLHWVSFRYGLEYSFEVKGADGLVQAQKLTLLGRRSAVRNWNGLGWIASPPISRRINILAAHAICDRLTSIRHRRLAVPAATSWCSKPASAAVTSSSRPGVGCFVHANRSTIKSCS